MSSGAFLRVLRCQIPTYRRQTRHASSSSSSSPVTAQWYGWGSSAGANTLPVVGEPPSDEKVKHDHPRKLALVSPSSDRTGGKGSTIDDIALGHENIGFLTDGSAFVWGKGNKNGELGLGPGSVEPVNRPAPLQLPEEERVAKLRLGSDFSAAVTESGNLYTWGWGGSAVSGMGMLGHGDGQSYSSPTFVSSLYDDGCIVSDISVGKHHSVVLTDEGEVLTAGAGSYGRLGNLEPNDQIHFTSVDLLTGTNVKEIAAGHAFTLALADDGIIHAWGRNDQGQLGVPGGFNLDMYSMESLPAMIEGQLEGRKVEKIAAGHSHAACITDTGECFMWGSKRYLEPELLTVLLSSRCVDVACGHNYTTVLTEEGALFTFGDGKSGCLGHASNKNLSQPELVEAFEGRKVVRVRAGMTQVACLVEDSFA